MSPLRSCMLRNIAGLISGALVALEPAGLPDQEQAEDHSASEHIQITGESPSHSGASGLGWTNPQLLD